MIQHILCVDMGGTHSRFAYFSLQDGELQLRAQHSCATSLLQSTGAALHEASVGLGIALEQLHMQIWGVAGPVHTSGLAAKLTNADLQLDFTEYPYIRAGYNFYLCNDLALQAWATLADEVPKLPILPAGQHSLSDTFSMGELQTSSATIDKLHASVRAMVGAGTGLGTAAFLPHRPQGGHRAQWTLLPSEAGHTDIPTYSKEEKTLTTAAMKRLQQDRLSAEDILSARGLTLLHALVHGEELSPAEVTAKLWEDSSTAQGSTQKTAEKSTQPAIQNGTQPVTQTDTQAGTQAGAQKDNQVGKQAATSARKQAAAAASMAQAAKQVTTPAPAEKKRAPQESKVLQFYARFLGRFCKQWALSTLCTGGLYLGGGVLMKNPAIVQHPLFAQEFYAAPASMQEIIQGIPIMLIQHEYAGLWGGAHMAKMYLEKG